jgi:hypothetical protein
MSPRVKTALACGLWLAVALGGCYWSRYADVMRMHAELLTSMLAKLSARPPTAPLTGAALSEYEYPLARARDFARIAAKRCPTRRSLAAFHHAMSAYERIVTRAAHGAGSARATNGRFVRRIARVERWLAREPSRCR